MLFTFAWQEKCLYNTIIMQTDDYWHNIILPVSYLLGKLEVCIISSICSDTAWHVIGLGEICINIQSQLSWCGVANKHGLGVLFFTADVRDIGRHIAVTTQMPHAASVCIQFLGAQVVPIHLIDFYLDSGLGSG